MSDKRAIIISLWSLQYTVAWNKLATSPAITALFFALY
jgi:hypothetical protein